MPFCDQWQPHRSPVEMADAVAYGNGRFVMVAGNRLAWWSDDGEEWWPVSTEVCLHAVVFGDGLFVAVGDQLMTSPDGDIWQIAVAASRDGQAWLSLVIPDTTLPDALGLSGVGYGEGLFVAVGPYGRIYTSTDPITHWQPQISATCANLVGVAYGEGTFVVVGERGTVLVSQDRALTWQAVDAGTQHHLRGVAYGHGVFVAVGERGTILRSSNRGGSWEAVSIEDAGDLRSIAYGHGAFAAVGDQVLTSSDGGLTWNGAGPTGESASTGGTRDDALDTEARGRRLIGVTYGQYRFIAVGHDGQLLRSERATAQLKLTLSSKPERGSVGKETELILTVANTGPDLAPGLTADLAMQGDFGIAAVLPSRGGYAMVDTFTLRCDVGALRVGEQATTRVIILPQSRGQIELRADAWADAYLSNPGAHRVQHVVPIEAPPPRPVERWLPRTFEPCLRDLRAAAYGNGVWVAVGDRGLIMGSWDDGVSWSEVDSITDCSLKAVAHGPAGFIAVGELGTILWSRDGQDWFKDELTPETDLHGVAYGPENLVVVGDAGTVFTRQLNGSWQRALTPTEATLRAVTNGGHHFTAVGDHGMIIESPDGWAWSLVPCEAPQQLRGVAHGKDSMVIVAADGSVITHSRDGWKGGPCDGARELHAVCYGRSDYLAVGGIFVSSSGSDWQECNVGQIGTFYGCAYGNGSFLVVGPHGIVMQSLPVAPPADLALELHCSPEVRRGQLLRSQVTVINRGPSPALRVALTAILPKGAAFEWAHILNGRCQPIGDTVYCELGELSSGAEVGIVIAVKALVPRAIRLHAVVSGLCHDPDLCNNHAHCVSQVVASGPVLSLTQRGSREARGLLFAAEIANLGPGPAYELVLTDPLPEGTVFLTASTSQGLFIVPKHGQHGSIVCQIGTLDKGERVALRLLAAVEDRSMRRFTNRLELSATNAKTISSTVVVKDKR